MKSILLYAMMLAGLPAAVVAQDGSDINQAIPVYFGQTVTDIGDAKTAPARIYSITLGKGQQLSVLLAVANSQPNANIEVGLLPTDRKTINGCYWSCNKAFLAGDYVNGRAVGFNYQVAAAGTYYVMVDFASSGVNYNLQITAQGPVIPIPIPSVAGCLTGQVDSITYSLQLIAASLPDETSIGGTKMCSSCTVKPPAYPQLIAKLENAMSLNVGVSACYDSSGSVFQLKLLHP